MPRFYLLFFQTQKTLIHLRCLEFSRLPLLALEPASTIANLPALAGDGEPMALLGEAPGASSAAAIARFLASSVVNYNRVYSWL